MNNCGYCNVIDSPIGGHVWHCTRDDKVCSGVFCENYEEIDSFYLDYSNGDV